MMNQQAAAQTSMWNVSATPQTGVIYIGLADTLPLNASYPNASIQLVGADPCDLFISGHSQSDVIPFGISKYSPFVFHRDPIIA